jgi:hypothetical protein
VWKRFHPLALQVCSGRVEGVDNRQGDERPRRDEKCIRGYVGSVVRWGYVLVARVGPPESRCVPRRSAEGGSRPPGGSNGAIRAPTILALEPPSVSH